MPQQLKNRRIAVLAINGFEQSELVEPRDSHGHGRCPLGG